jgi:hypothetical protein
MLVSLHKEAALIYRTVIKELVVICYYVPDFEKYTVFSFLCAGWKSWKTNPLSKMIIPVI